MADNYQDSSVSGKSMNVWNKIYIICVTFHLIFLHGVKISKYILARAFLRITWKLADYSKWFSFTVILVMIKYWLNADETPDPS